MKKRWFGMIVVGCLCGQPCGWALSVWINGTGTPYTNIQDAVNAASGGNWLAIAAGVYHEAVQVKDKDLGLQGGYDETTTNFTGGYTAIDGDNARRPLLYTNASGQVTDLHLIHGNASQGGGADIETGDVLFENVVIASNQANVGGGIYVAGDAHVVLSNQVWVVTNTAGNNGGGVFVEGRLETVHSTVRINGNIAGNSGGGVYCIGIGTGQARLREGQIADNIAAGSIADGEGYGGGVAVIDGQLYLGCAVFNNRAKYGGGIYAHGVSVLSVRRAAAVPSLTDNLALYGGGLFVTNCFNVELNAVLERNLAAFRGGGACFYASSVTNGTDEPGLPVLADNTASIGGGFHLESATGLWHDATIGQPDHPNVAQYFGGGACVVDGRLDLRGGGVQYNLATSTVASCGGGLALIRSRLDLHPSAISPRVLVSSNRANETAGAGGGLYFESCPVTAQLAQVTLAYNRAGGGGGLYATNSPCRATGLVAEHNEAVTGSGGGVLLIGAGHVLEELALTGNRAAEHGGGVAILHAAGASLAGGPDFDPDAPAFVIQSNACGGMGGGVYATFTPVDIRHLAILTNAAQSGGGVAVMNSADSLCVFSNVLVAQNEAFHLGGGLLLWDSAADLWDTDAQDNLTRNFGGGGAYIGGSRPVRWTAWSRPAAVLQNFAATDGGGIYCNLSSPLQLAGVDGNALDFQFNQAVQNGGGLFSLLNGGVICSGLVQFSANYSLSNGGAMALASDVPLRLLESEPGAFPSFIMNIAGVDGGAIHGDPGSTCVVERALFMSNQANQDGGAIACCGGRLVCDHGDFFANTAGRNGGAVHGRGAELVAFNQVTPPWPVVGQWTLLFEQNEAQENGGALYLEQCPDARVYRAAIFLNRTVNGEGGAIYAQDGRLDLHLTLLAQNDAETAGLTDGVLWNNSTGFVRQCTVADNDAVGLAETNSRVALIESIAWGHLDAAIRSSSSAPTATWCCIEGGWSNSSHTITNPPRLYAEYYHLQYNSPCIDAGDVAPYDTDIDNEPRVGLMDIGFDEFTDTDGDKLPDLVESDSGTWNGELDTGTSMYRPDSDGDALGDGDEWIADTDPSDFNSRLELVSAQRLGGSLQVSQAGGTNANLRLSMAEAVASTNWIGLETRWAPTGRTNLFTVTTNLTPLLLRVEAFR